MLRAWRLIIVWLEVRVLPAPPRSPAQTEISRFSAKSPELAAIRARILSPWSVEELDACFVVCDRGGPAARRLSSTHAERGAKDCGEHRKAARSCCWAKRNKPRGFQNCWSTGLKREGRRSGLHRCPTDHTDRAYRYRPAPSNPVGSRSLRHRHSNCNRRDGGDRNTNPQLLEPRCLLRLRQ
jgi:hypothetical protein